MALWPCFGTSQLPRNHPRVAVLILHLRVMCLRPSELLAGRKQAGSCPIAGATSPTLVSRHHKLRNESIYQDRCPRLTGPRRPKLVLVCQQSLTLTKLWISERDNLEVRYTAATKLFRAATGALELSGMTRFQTRHCGANVDRLQVLGTRQGVQIRRQLSMEIWWRLSGISITVPHERQQPTLWDSAA